MSEYDLRDAVAASSWGKSLEKGLKCVLQDLLLLVVERFLVLEKCSWSGVWLEIGMARLLMMSRVELYLFLTSPLMWRLLAWSDEVLHHGGSKQNLMLQFGTQPTGAT